MFRLPFLMACVLVAISLTIPGSVRAGESGTLVVLNKSDATASLVDLGKNKVVATVATGVGPHEVTVSPDGKLAVVCNYGTREEEGSSLTVIDVPAGRAVKTISLGEYRRPHGIAWVPGKRSVVAVTAEDNQALLTVDVEKGEVTKSIPTGQEVSHMVVVSPDGSRAFVANIGSGSIPPSISGRGSGFPTLPLVKAQRESISLLTGSKSGSPTGKRTRSPSWMPGP